MDSCIAQQTTKITKKLQNEFVPVGSKLIENGGL